MNAFYKIGLTCSMMIFGGFAAFAQGANDPTPSGTTETMAIETGAFSSVSLSGLDSVRIMPGNDDTLSISGDTAYLNDVQWENANGMLTIGTGSSKALPLEVTVTVKDLDGLRLENGARAVIDAMDAGDDLSLFIEEDSELNTNGALEVGILSVYNKRGFGGSLEVNADQLFFESNHGLLDLQGKSTMISGKLMGSADASITASVQQGDFDLSNTSALDAKLPGLSAVSVSSNQDASASIAMNGRVRAMGYGDSSIKITGAVKSDRVYEDDDASVVVRNS